MIIYLYVKPLFPYYFLLIVTMTKAIFANSQQLLIIILFLCEVITFNKINMNFLILFVLFLLSIYPRSWQNNQALDSTLIFIIQLTDSITKKDRKEKLKTRSCHAFILLNQDTTNRIELRKTVKIGVVMMIRYQGTSPMLGSCQGECPYPVIISPSLLLAVEALMMMQACRPSSTAQAHHPRRMIESPESSNLQPNSSF